MKAILKQAPGQPREDRQFSFVVLLLLAAGALYVAYLIYRPFLAALFLALVLTVAFLPMHEWICRKVRSANAATLLTETIIVLFVLVPLIWVSIKLLAETVSLYGFLAQQQWGANIWSGHFTWLSEAINWIGRHGGVSPERLKASITARVQASGALLLETATWIAGRLVQQITTAVLTLLVLFFFLRDRQKFSRGLADVLPLPPGRVQQLGVTLYQTVLANTYGMLAVALIEGALVAIGFWMTGLRAPLLWGAIAAFLSLLPRGGPTLVWMPGVIVLVMQGNLIKAILLFIWGVALVLPADFVVRDRVTAGSINASKLLILLAAFGGLRVFGAIGIIAGPVVLSLVISLMSMVREEYGSLREARKTTT